MRRENKQSTVGNLAENNLITVDVWDADRLQLECLHVHRMGVPAAPPLWHHHDYSLVWPMILSWEGYGDGAHHVNYSKNKAPRHLLLCRWLWRVWVWRKHLYCWFEIEAGEGESDWKSEFVLVSTSCIKEFRVVQYHWYADEFPRHQRDRYNK